VAANCNITWLEIIVNHAIIIAKLAMVRTATIA
jgi:hypothetical protein